MLDPDLEIREGPVIQTLTFGPQFGPKIRGAAPPLDPLPLGVKTPLLLNSSYVLFLRCRSWDNTLENCFVRNWLSPRVCVRIILEKTRWKFSFESYIGKAKRTLSKTASFSKLNFQGL